MVVALLLCLAGTVGTGLVAYGDIGKGPLANSTGTVSAVLSNEQNEGSAAGEQARRRRHSRPVTSRVANSTARSQILRYSLSFFTFLELDW